MKIRNGFVSNSSSSSFVIDADKKTIIDVAFDMVPARDWGESDTILQEKLLNFKGSADTPIAFKSCNYNTFILKHNNLIYVETCHNHDWSKHIKCRYPTQEEVKSLGLDDFWEDFMLKKLNKFFWWPEYDFFARSLWPEYNFCKTCFYDIVELETGEKICPHCKKDIKEIGNYIK